MTAQRLAQQPCVTLRRSGGCKITSSVGSNVLAQPCRQRSRPMHPGARSCSYVAKSVGLGVDKAAAARDAEYNHRMAQQMGWQNADAYTYYYDRGIYSHEILPNLIVGTMPRNTSDLDWLFFHERVDTILNLQQNEDFHHWNVDFHSIYHRAVDTHGMEVVRRPAVDFDPHSLRKVLPSAVRVVAEALDAGKRVYVHCTAGLGRAPAVVIAYMYWFGTKDLDEAYQELTSIRPCGPKKDAIRGATFDVLDDRSFDQFAHLPKHAFTSLNDQDRQIIQQRVMSWE